MAERENTSYRASCRSACAVTTRTGHHGGLQHNTKLSKSFARCKGENVIPMLLNTHTSDSGSLKINKNEYFKITRHVTVLQRTKAVGELISELSVRVNPKYHFSPCTSALQRLCWKGFCDARSALCV